MSTSRKRVGFSLALIASLSTMGCRPAATGTAGRKSLPVLQAEGWLGGQAPNSASLGGQVVVISCWAFW